MIFVTVGTNIFPFNRLLEELDSLIKNGKIKDDIIAQTGYSTYTPRNYKFLKFVTVEEFEALIKKSNIVISHAGAGSIITALGDNKPLIIVPRVKKFNEHSDDHQLQITKELVKQKRVIAVYSIKKLYNAIKKSQKFKIQRKRTNKIINIVDNFIHKVEKHG